MMMMMTSVAVVVMIMMMMIDGDGVISIITDAHTIGWPSQRSDGIDAHQSIG